MKRLFLMFSVGALLASGVIYAVTIDQRDSQKESAAGGKVAEWAAAADSPAQPVLAKPVEVVLNRTYLCGVKTEEKRQLSGTSIEQVLADHTGWEIVSVTPDQVVLHKAENDIAPSCKENGYFGLSEDGMLTLFNGLPSEKKVVQTFYQINTERMEASLSSEEVELLKKGIRVRDLAEYNSILSTYGQFQTGPAETPGH
ncbi:MAG: BofC C-terminal domain-containing protein [Brevibacillus sp.]|nr:BofC C-terminal domain-containing protein [Brevibacillus sp.]